MRRFSFVPLLAAFVLILTSLPVDAHPKKEERREKGLSQLEQLEEHQSGQKELPHEEYIDLLNELAISYRYKNTDCIRFYSEMALKHNSEEEYLNGYINSEIYLAYYYAEASKYDESLFRFEKLRTKTDEIGDPELSVNLMRFRVMYDLFSGSQKDLIKHTYESIDLCQKYGYKKQEAILHHNLGFTYYRYGLHDKAKEEYTKSEALWNELDQPENAAYACSNMALNAVDAEDYETFHIYRKKSIDILNSETDPLWSSRAYRVYAHYYIKRNNLDSALYWTDKAQKLINQLKNKRDQLELNTLYTDLYIRRMELDKAEEQAIAAIQLSKFLKDSIDLVGAYENYKKIAMLQGDQEKAYSLLLEYTDLKTKFDRVAANQTLDFLRAQSQYDADIAAKESALAEKNWIILGILFLLFCVLAILYLASQNYANQKEANKKLSQLNDSKDKLFSIISHDLISPVNTLKEMLTLYRDNVLSESEVLESIPRLKSRVDMSSFALNNLLYWAQTQMSGFHANPVEVDLKKRAQMTCSFFNEDIENKNISLNCEIPVGYKARFDVNHLDVILRNLVSNAIKFTPEGGEIQFRITELDNRIAFEVINEGVSIPTEVIQALEDDQTYSSSPGTRQEKGTGVGLKIAKELTELNGGEFELVTPGVDGTTVRIYLPKVSPLKAVV
ncbi:tetratricopeptide repeat-containing sensor histidine kinase [Aureicoccus marinus]|uniref:histidine kinase n=1 Tax=Aureicoccus marinus TaxID=754435 RepID=A0A2S7T5S6_9FLAO|nr:ATP-binding protein [Aureicoccus marinus]PQJ15282.1 hypothetical protein BST99_05635 [Aureicoccus marinus]